MNDMALFEERQVRRVFHDEEWWFVLTDVVSALTDSPAPSDYLKKLRRRDPSLAEAFKGGGQFAPPLALPFETEGGMQRLQCWNVPGVLRLIQSIPSPKAEPFKRWLAKVGYERLQEIADPALGLERTRENWRKLGRSEKWITQRMTGQETRNKLTDYWASHEVKQGAPSIAHFAMGGIHRSHRSSPLSGPIEWLDLRLFLLGCSPHIVIGLQLIPDFSVGAERSGKTQRHIGRDTGLAIENAGKRCARDLQMLCGGCYVQVAQKLP